MRNRSTRPPGRPRQSEQRSTPDMILRTAAHLFMESGYDAVSVDAMAEAVGITKASIYYYFPTKSDVFTAAMEALMVTIHRESKRILDGPGPFGDRLRALAAGRLAVAETRFDYDRVLAEADPQLTPGQRERLQEAMHRVSGLIVDAFRVESQKGTIRPTNADFAAHAFLALLNVGYARKPDGSRIFANAQDAADAVVSLVLSGLSSPG